MAQGPARISSGSSAWVDITGKPSTFPPSAHTHPATDVTEDTTHRFATDMEKTTWNAKVSFPGFGTTAGTAAEGNDVRLSDARTPLAHNQAWSTITTTPTTLTGYGITDAQPSDADLTALAGLSTTGLVARTGAGTAATRTIIGTANQVTVTNGDGISGDPTLSLPANIATTSAQFALLGIGVGAVAGHTIIANNTDANRVLFAGTTKGIRFAHNAAGSVLEGVDNTGSASYQPLYLGGSSLVMTISGDEAARLTSSGLGIGTDAPNHKVTVGGNGTFGYGIQQSDTTVAAITANTSTGELRHFASTNYFPTFYSNGVEAMRIDLNGAMSLGAVIGSPRLYAYKDAAANAGLGINLAGGSGELSVFAGTTTDAAGIISFGRRRVDSGTYTERANINLATGAVRFNAYGAGTLVTDSSGNITASSDASLKTVTGSFTRGLVDVLKLTPRTYHWNEKSGMDTEDENVGFIAQEVLDAVPEAVGQYRTSEVEVDGKKTKKREKAELLTLSDRPLIAALVNAVKELKAENDALSARIAKLEGKK